MCNLRRTKQGANEHRSVPIMVADYEGWCGNIIAGIVLRSEPMGLAVQIADETE